MYKQTLYQKTDDLSCSLQSTQEWFASIITSPLAKNDSINPMMPNGMLIAEEAARYIVPSPTLLPHQRLQIYNQQYWWRLLNTLHANFPLVTRLFGYQAFNEKIGLPYLHQCPPNHWSLTLLGERLPSWVANHYTKPDKPLIHNAANLDWAFTASFIAPQHPPLDLNQLAQEDPSLLLSKPFYLQPHIHLFEWDYDLLAFRELFLQEEVDYWTEHRFPALPKKQSSYFALYRTLKNSQAWREITKGEYFLLQLFQKGSSVEAACEVMEEQELAVYEQVAANLQKWIQDWTRLGWLTLKEKV